MAIGIVGAGLGFGIGYLIIHNINTIHGWLGQVLGVVIWDPEVYAFDTRDGHVLARIKVGKGPHGLAVFPQPGRYSLGHNGNFRFLSYTRRYLGGKFCIEDGVQRCGQGRFL